MCVASAHGQIPANVTPGAVEPQRPAEVLPEREEDIVTVPAPSRRQLGQSDTVIDVREFVVIYDFKDQVEANVIQRASAELDSYLQNKAYKVTFSELEEAVQLLTTELRSSGYLLARAVLPPQEIERAVVRLNVYVGILGGTYTIDNDLYKAHVLEAPFDEHLGKVVERSSVESALLRLRDLPGLEVVAVFRPGKEVGETALGVRVVGEKHAEYSLRLDNHGIEPTGDLRLHAGVAVNNITGHRDRLRVDAIRTFDSGDLRNARFNYEITDPDLLHTLGLGFSETRYEVEGGPARILGLEGDTEIGEAYVRSQWIRSSTHNLATNVSLSTKRAESSSNFSGVLDGVDRLTVGTISIVVDGVDSRLKGIHRATLTFHRGFEDFIGSMDDRGNFNSLGEIPSATGAATVPELPGRFEKVTATYNRLQSLTQYHSLLLRTAAQYSNDYLSSLEKMSLGGPYTVRAYPVAELVSDRAIFASLAWVVNGGQFSEAPVYGDYTLADLIDLSLFVDYGWGKNRNADGSVARREIDGAGIQLDFRVPQSDFYLELIAAQTLGSDESVNGDDFQFWFNAGVRF